MHEHEYIFGRVLRSVIGTYSLAAIAGAYFVTDGYWRSILLETGIGLFVYLLVSLALAKKLHTRHHARIAFCSFATIFLLLVTANFMESAYWQELFISLGAALALGTALEFLLENPQIAISTMLAQELVFPEPLDEEALRKEARTPHSPAQRLTVRPMKLFNPKREPKPREGIQPIDGGRFVFHYSGEGTSPPITHEGEETSGPRVYEGKTVSPRVVGRDELKRLMEELKKNPVVWYVDDPAEFGAISTRRTERRPGRRRRR